MSTSSPPGSVRGSSPLGPVTARSSWQQKPYALQSLERSAGSVILQQVRAIERRSSSRTASPEAEKGSSDATSDTGSTVKPAVPVTPELDYRANDNPVESWLVSCDAPQHERDELKSHYQAKISNIEEHYAARLDMLEEELATERARFATLHARVAEQEAALAQKRSCHDCDELAALQEKGRDMEFKAQTDHAQMGWDLQRINQLKEQKTQLQIELREMQFENKDLREENASLRTVAADSEELMKHVRRVDNRLNSPYYGYNYREHDSSGNPTEFPPIPLVTSQTSFTELLSVCLKQNERLHRTAEKLYKANTLNRLQHSQLDAKNAEIHLLTTQLTTLDDRLLAVELDNGTAQAEIARLQEKTQHTSQLEAEVTRLRTLAANDWILAAPEEYEQHLEEQEETIKAYQQRLVDQERLEEQAKLDAAQFGKYEEELEDVYSALENKERLYEMAIKETYRLKGLLEGVEGMEGKLGVSAGDYAEGGRTQREGTGDIGPRGGSVIRERAAG